MFRQRLITALILIPICFALIIYASKLVFAIVLALLFLLGGFEWTALASVKETSHKSVLLLILSIGFALCYVYGVTAPLMLFIALVWLCFFLAIMVYPKWTTVWNHQALLISLMYFVLLGCFNALLTIHQAPHGQAYFIYLLLLIWAADTGAYFAGKQFGRNKLIPSVSPGKTIEGVLGALLLVLVISALGQWYFDIKAWGLWYVLSVITFVASIFGDLLISMFKRNVDLKDTGHVLPGHGGILDRIDSLLSASLFFLLVASYLRLI